MIPSAALASDQITVRLVPFHSSLVLILCLCTHVHVQVVSHCIPAAQIYAESI